MKIAMIFNSTVIEINDDKFLISYVFKSCQMLERIAASITGDQGAGINDISNFFRSLTPGLLRPPTDCAAVPSDLLRWLYVRNDLQALAQ